MQIEPRSITRRRWNEMWQSQQNVLLDGEEIIAVAFDTLRLKEALDARTHAPADDLEYVIPAAELAPGVTLEEAAGRDVGVQPFFDLPAPATDVDALLAEAEMLLAWSCSDVKDNPGAVLQTVSILATALRESRAREQAEPYRHALEQRLICSNLPLLTGNADADLMRFVFHEQEIALSPEAGVIAELKEQRDTALSWTATYTNMDVYRRCLAAAIARAEKAEAEAKEANSTLDMYAKAWWRELKGPYRNKRHEIDALVLTTRERISERDAAIARAEEFDNVCLDLHNVQTELDDAVRDLAAARAELGALGPVEGLNMPYGVIRVRRVLEGGAQ